MNVLYLTNNGGRASTTVPTKGWFEHLADKGLSPVLASPVLGEFSDWCEAREIPTYRLGLPFPDKLRPWKFGHSLWKLKQIVRRHRIQLIHCNEQDIYPISQYLAQACRIPVVVSVHFTLDRGFCEWAFRGKRRPSRIFFISQGSLEACRPAVTGLVPEEDWRLLYNGLDLTHYQLDSSRRAEFRSTNGLDGCIAIGTACAIRPRKQLEHLFEVAARIDDPRLRVVVAGSPMPGDEQYAETLFGNGKQLLGDRLIQLGYMTELRGFFNGLDLLVNTSQEEACSISIMESLACGCPVLGYPSKSVDCQVLPDGGEMVAQDNLDDLTESLKHWISTPDRISSARTGARKQAESMFDIRALSNQLWSEYQSLVQDSFEASATIAGVPN